MVDETDMKILASLQHDAGLPQKVIAGNLGLTEATLSKKIRKLKDDGIIKKYTIEINFAKIGYLFSAVTMVKEKQQSDTESTASFISSLPEAVEIYKVIGEWDFAVLWLCKDPENLDTVLSKVLHHTNVEKVESTFFMRAVKREAGVPLK